MLDGVKVARRLVQLRFPGARAARLGGSLATGMATTTSDLDIIVLLDEPPAPLRASTVVEGWPVELFDGEPGAGLVDRVRANTAFGLALVVCEHGADRLGRCQAAGCDRVYADVQRGPRRRYCSRACQNRSSVAAFRARRAS